MTITGSERRSTVRAHAMTTVLVLVGAALLAAFASTPVPVPVAAAAGPLPTSSEFATASGYTTSVSRQDFDVSTWLLAKPVVVPEGITRSDAFVNDPNAAIQWPFSVGVPVGDRFGPRDCAGCTPFHHGTDFNPGDGAPIQIIADGVVRSVDNGDGSLGVNVIIDHQIDGELVSSVYAHMQHGSVQVAEGESVHVGQLVGVVGSTGYSTGPHLHFEIRLNGTDYVDSFDWLVAHTR